MKLPVVPYNKLGEHFGTQSCMLQDLPRLPECLDWQWVLETLDTHTQTHNERVQSFPNGGFVINNPELDLEPSPFTFFENRLRDHIQYRQVIRSQIYISLSIKSNLFSKHTDPGQNSLVWQCQGRTAVEIGDAYGVLEPGDVLYLHNDTPHRFTSMGPRFSITFSLEDD